MEAIAAAPFGRDPHGRFAAVYAAALAELHPQCFVRDALNVCAMNREQRLDRRRLRFEPEPGQVRADDIRQSRRSHTAATASNPLLEEMRSTVQHAAGASIRSWRSRSAVRRWSIARYRTSTGPWCPVPTVAVTGH